MNSEELLRRGRIGRWRVIGLIGEGGFSWVFEVEDKNSGKRLALKVLKPEAAEGEQYRRFWREAKLLAAQDDPHLVQIVMLDRDEELRLDFYVMELLTGRNLSQLLKADGALAVSRAVEIFLGALQGLSRLHLLPKPIIHRDIKPANIQITDDGRTKLLDLGIAGTQRNRGEESLAGSEDNTFTTAAEFKGTVKYSSAEQLQILELDTSSDVFSMGLCLFEAIEGRHAYKDQADLPSATYTYQTVLSFYARLEGNRGEIPLKFQRTPKPIQAVVRKALSLKPRDRYRTAGEMREALKRAHEAGGATLTGRTSPDLVRAEGVRPARRWLPIAALAAGLLLAAGVGSWWLLFPTPGGEVEEDDSTKRPVEIEKKQQAVKPPARDRSEATPREATAGQRDIRDEAAKVVAEVERLRSEGKVDESDAGRVISSWQAGDTHWTQNRFADAERAYKAAISEGNQVIVPVMRHLELATLTEQRQAAEKARELAKQAGAESSASGDWNAAEDLLKQAQLAESERHAPDALARYASARASYETAASAAGKALANARAAEKGALASRARLPKQGDCRALSERKAKGVCEDAARALAEGSAALLAMNVPAALEQLQGARARFDEALKLTGGTVATNKPPTLDLDPAGSFRLMVGESQTLQATARDPEGKAVTVEYTIKVPGGGKRTATGEELRFEPEREGAYVIEARARDADGGVSALRKVNARVSRRIEAQPAPSKPVEIPPSKVVEIPPEKPVETARRVPDIPPPPAVGNPETILDEYKSAIESKDLDALKAAWKMDAQTEGLFSKIFASNDRLSMSVTLLRKAASGDKATLHFSQSFQKIDNTGKRIVISEKPMVAQVMRRSDGWQIQSLRPDG